VKEEHRLSQVKAEPAIWSGFAGFTARLVSLSWQTSPLLVAGIILTTLSCALTDEIATLKSAALKMNLRMIEVREWFIILSLGCKTTELGEAPQSEC
jgi:hypothetical protein